MILSNMRCFIVICSLCLPIAASAGDALPVLATQQLAQPLKQVGSGTYTKLGFTIYHVTLWTLSGRWNPAEPHALHLHYHLSLSKETIVNTVAENLREQGVADATTLEQWEAQLDATVPTVYDGDAIVALAVPGKSSTLFHNEKLITTIANEAFSDAFFGIWLGKTADARLRQELLGI